MNMISEEVLALEPDIIAWRRHMHQNPELSFQEVHTTAYLTEELKKIPGLTLEFPTKTGVVAVLKGVQPGPVLALRADIDALPIQEETGLPYASTVSGVMHACGHDGHAAMQLAAAKLLAAERTSLRGEVRFLFQHAEELPPGGAVEMLKAGVMEGVDELYGMHLSSNFPTGTFGVRPGALTSATDRFDIRVIGKASDVGELDVLCKTRGEHGALERMVLEMKAHGLTNGRVHIDHCCNAAAAERLKHMVHAVFPEAKVEVGSCGALCSYYAEYGGLMVGYEDNEAPTV